MPADGEEAVARITHRFDRAGSFMLRIGIPTQPGEKVTNDNFITHPLRVIDRRIKLLYVEHYPRHEYKFLAQALIRDTDTFETQVFLIDRSPGYIQFATDKVPPLRKFPHSRRELMEYDVIIFGDVDWRALSADPEQAKQDLENVRAFVEAGGGLFATYESSLCDECGRRRRDFALAHDGQGFLLFGGQAGSALVGDTWRYDGVQWSMLGGGGFTPINRTGHA
ncbi:MAG: hypothetical protein GY704_00165, partial [Phycisphaeraceae bacterium]|nr:hypothetical protein [Phycisphaeraceae bacterium]